MFSNVLFFLICTLACLSEETPKRKLKKHRQKPEDPSKLYIMEKSKKRKRSRKGRKHTKSPSPEVSPTDAAQEVNALALVSENEEADALQNGKIN